jgi:L-2-hydroxyglutarate oxidase LhgO
VYSDRVAGLSGGQTNPVIVPVRGEYLELDPCRHYLVKGLIYPVPDLSVPFLGVHFTPTMDGRVLIGPNAVMAFSREGYSYSDVRLKDLWDVVTSSGFRKMATKHWKFGLGELYRRCAG